MSGERQDRGSRGDQSRPESTCFWRRRRYPFSRARFLASVFLDRILPAHSELRRSADAAEFWSESSNSVRIRDLSHWAGQGRWSQESWVAIGQAHVKKWQRFASISGREQATARMVEWGPGGGANAVAFAEVFRHFYAVDISRANLDECGRQMDRCGHKGFTPVLVAPHDPATVLTKINQPCDFFLSTAVFQHFPSKEYGGRVLGVAAELLPSGAPALVHIRYHDDERILRPKRRDYKGSAVAFTAYRIEEFWDLCRENRLDPQFIELEPASHNAYYYLCRR